MSSPISLEIIEFWRYLGECGTMKKSGGSLEPLILTCRFMVQLGLRWGVRNSVQFVMNYMLELIYYFMHLSSCSQLKFSCNRNLLSLCIFAKDQINKIAGLNQPQFGIKYEITPKVIQNRSNRIHSSSIDILPFSCRKHSLDSVFLQAVIQKHTFSVVSYTNITMRKLTFFVLALIALHVVAQQAEDTQYLQMRRTACVILSRMHSNQEKSTIEEVIQGLEPNDQQKYINKLYAVAVEKCQGQITQQQVQSFYVESQEFNPATLFPLLDGMNYREAVNDLTTTKEQDQITKFIKKFDEENQIRQQERQAKKQQEAGAEQKYEMKLLGISIKDLSSGAKLTYVSIFAALVIGALYYGLSNLDQKKQVKGNKRRSPKKGKTQASPKAKSA